MDEVGQTDEWRPEEHVQQGSWRIRLLSVQLNRIVPYIDLHAKGAHIATGFSSGFFSPFISLACSVFLTLNLSLASGMAVLLSWQIIINSRANRKTALLQTLFWS